VIGGLLCATVATLIFVPAVFSLLHKKGSETDISPVENKTEGEPTHA
jgi:hypothetical protein